MMCRLISMTLALLMLASGQWGLAQSQHKMTKTDVENQIKKFSNWGRWGKDDQLGTLNLITARKRVQAAQLVQLGISVSLARQAETAEAARSGMGEPSPCSWVTACENPTHCYPRAITKGCKCHSDAGKG